LREYYPYYYGQSLINEHSLANRHSAVQTLSDLIHEYVRADYQAQDARQHGGIDGEQLFERMDIYR